MREAAAAADWRTQIADDVAFHRTMVELAGNEPLLQSWLVLGVEVSTAFAMPDLVGSDRARRVPRPDRRGDPGRRLPAAGAEASKHVGGPSGGTSSGSSCFR